MIRILILAIVAISGWHIGGVVDAQTLLFIFSLCFAALAALSILLIIEKVTR